MSDCSEEDVLNANEHQPLVWNERALSVGRQLFVLQEILLVILSAMVAMDVKTFLRFFYFVNVFIYKKRSLKIISKSSRSTFETTDKIINRPMNVAGCRGVPIIRTELITLGSAYSDTAAVTSCSRRSQYVK